MGFSCVRFLSRLWIADLNNFASWRTLSLHPYTFKQSTIIVRKDANGKTVYVKQEARTNKGGLSRAPDHVHYKRPTDRRKGDSLN